MGHLRVTVGHPRVTIGHLGVIMGHLRAQSVSKHTTLYFGVWPTKMGKIRGKNVQTYIKYPFYSI